MLSFIRNLLPWSCKQPNNHLKLGETHPLNPHLRQQRVWIAGYSDLTKQEFDNHYRYKIKTSIHNGATFILSDEPGTCSLAFDYLLSKRDVAMGDITIYRSSSTPHKGRIPTHRSMRKLVKRLPSSKAGKCRIVTIPGGEKERMAVMDRESDSEIVWLRPGDTLADHNCQDIREVMTMRFVGPKEVMRMGMVKGMDQVLPAADEVSMKCYG